jgi:hypothetical protein
MFRRKKTIAPRLSDADYAKAFPLWLDRTRLLGSYKGVDGGVAWHFEKWEIDRGDAGEAHVLFDAVTHDEIIISGPLTQASIRAYAKQRFAK